MDGKTSGYLPSNYVKVLGLKRGQRQTPSPEVRQEAETSNQKTEEEVNLQQAFSSVARKSSHG